MPTAEGHRSNVTQIEDDVTEHAPAGEDAIRELVKRLARPHKSGGTVVERATLRAEGSDFTAILEWVAANSGKPETPVEAAPGGLHGSRVSSAPAAGTPLRYVFPAGTF